jgi:hypothetical protein
VLTKLGTMADSNDDITSLLDGLELRLFRLKEETDRAIHESELQIDKLSQIVKRQDKFIEYLKVGTSRAAATGSSVPFSARENSEGISGTSASSPRAGSSAASTTSSSTVTSDYRSTSSEGSTSSDGSFTETSTSCSSSTSIVSTSGAATLVSLSTESHESSRATEHTKSIESVDGHVTELTATEETVDLKAPEEVSTISIESIPFVPPKKAMPTAAVPRKDDCHDQQIWHTVSPSQRVDKYAGFERSLSSSIRSSTDEISDDSRRRMVKTASFGSIKSQNGLVNDCVASSDCNLQLVPSWDSASSKKEEMRRQAQLRENKVRNLLTMLHMKLKKRSSASENGIGGSISHD